MLWHSVSRKVYIVLNWVGDAIAIDPKDNNC